MTIIATPRMLKLAEAARILERSEQTLMRWHQRGVFPTGTRSASGERLFPEHEVRAIKRYMVGRKRLKNARALASPAAGRETMEARFSETLDATPALADPADLLRDLRDREAK